MLRGHVAVVCLAGVPDLPLLRGDDRGGLTVRSPEVGELYESHRQQLDWVDALVADHGISRAYTVSDVEQAHAAGQPALIGTVEGLDFLDGELERLAKARARGVRVVQLVHYTPNTVGDYQTGEIVHGGLTEFGVEAVRECNRLGLVIDVAHAMEETVRRAAQVAVTPLLLSHTALKESRAMDPGRLPGRRVTPEHARLVAETDGAVGVWHFFPSLELYVEGIKELVEIVGVEHVCIGTDQQVGAVGALQDYGDLPRLVDLLLGDGFSEPDIARLIGGNFLRIFERSIAPS